MKTIAFLGLGIMGLPMARNLVDAGYSVIGYNRSRVRVELLVEHGGQGANNIGEAVRTADVVITMLPDSPDVEDVVLGADGILAAARSGTFLIDMSSIAPSTARRIADHAANRGVRTLDAPVSGGEQAAIEGNLSIMVGGDPDDLEAVRPILDALGSTVIGVGPAGAGQTVKAANQLIVAGNIQIVAEALTLLTARGVDLHAATTVLAGGLAGSRILERKAQGMIDHSFEPGFRSELHHKDLGIAMAEARTAGVVMPVGGMLAQLMASLVATGHGRLDHSALILGVERLSGTGSTPPS